MVVVSLCTRPRNVEEIRSLTWTWDMLFSPKDEPRRPFFQSVGFWWVLFVLFYISLIIYLR